MSHLPDKYRRKVIKVNPPLYFSSQNKPQEDKTKQRNGRRKRLGLGRPETKLGCKIVSIL